MFPRELDDAKVLYYSSRGEFGTLNDATGEIVEHCNYFAICKYENDDSCYLFCCNDQYEVISDWLLEDIEACMNTATLHANNVIWHMM